ncbi:MAG: TatD family hydrolase [bacterium]|nr:TatD family hydrolase [bacterium]
MLARAAAVGVMKVVVPAYDAPCWAELARLAVRPGVVVGLGLHPWLAHDLPTQVAALEGATAPPAAFPGSTAAEAARAAALDSLLEHLAGRIGRQRPAAIGGEIGLDTKITSSGLVEQMPLLERQLELAADLDLPVILHCRGAFEEMLAAIGRHRGRLRGVVHAYSRGPELAARFVDAGLHIALGGAATHPRAQQVRRAARTIPLDRLVLETDAPAIGLENVTPEQTEPRHVHEVANAVALLRGQSVESLAAATSANAAALFSL